MQFYNPYYPDIAGISSFQASTTNQNTVDLGYIGKQDQDRDNSLTFELMLDDYPDDISIEIMDVKKQSELEEPLLKINFSEKPKNEELQFKIIRIPDGLYNVNIFSHIVTFSFGINSDQIFSNS